MKQTYIIHTGFTQVFTYIGAFTALLQTIFYPLLAFGPAYYFWLLGSTTKGEVVRRRDQVKVLRYRGVFLEVERIFIQNKGAVGEEYSEMRSDLNDMLRM